MAENPIKFKTYTGDKRGVEPAQSYEQTQEFKHGFAEGVAEERKHAIGRTALVLFLGILIGAFGGLKLQEAVSVQKALDVTLVGNALGNIGRAKDEYGNPVVTPPADTKKGKQ